MTMRVYMIAKIVEIFLAYFFITLVVPMFVLHKRISVRKFSERIILYSVSGNFFVITLVILLQLLHISNYWTLLLGTVVPVYILYTKLNAVKADQQISSFSKNTRWLLTGTTGIKTVFEKATKSLRQAISAQLQILRHLPAGYVTEVIMNVLLFAAAAYVFSAGIVRNYGYSVSDLTVHNYWIDELTENNLFAGGIYPMGFHAIIYYLHTIFGFETYVILSLFAFVQDIAIFFSVFFVLRNLCKGRFMAYAVMILYLLCDIWGVHTFERFGSALPQEFGMMFVFPAIYYAMTYLKIKYKEVVDEEPDESSEHICLVGFGMAVSLCLSIHFYNMVVVGLFGIAIAIGYFGLIWRKEFFKNILLAGLIGAGIAILPMALCFITGTPMEGSMRWGINVIKRSVNTSPIKVEYTLTGSENGTASHGYSVGNNGYGSSGNTQSGNVLNSPVVSGRPATEKVYNDSTSAVAKIVSSIDETLFNTNISQMGVMSVIMVAWMVFAAGLFRFFGERCYGSMVLSTAIYMVFMSIMLASASLGIPYLMDQSRTSIFFTFSMPFVLALALDSIVYLPTVKLEGRFIPSTLSLFLFILAIGAVILIPKSPFTATGLEMNESVTCLTNIIKTEDDYTWTIISANDKLRMGWEHGYHYELRDFLDLMEPYDRELTVTVPTDKVFIFIEKVPLESIASSASASPKISGKFAAMTLPTANYGIAVYQGLNRLICMSKMYFWMQDFIAYYPNDVRIYLETERFVCYEIRQNSDRLLNFAIDYGYNRTGGE